MDANEPLLLGYEFHGPRKIDLPESALEALDISTLDRSPLIYRISYGETATFVGVREFSAPEGQCGLSAALTEQLNLKIGDSVTVERVELPKGTQVSLKTATDAIDWKSLLEVWLPQNCTALAVGDMLRVEYSGEVHQLHVVGLAPEGAAGAAVCVVDTDMDLIVEATAPLASEPPTQPPALEFNREIDLGSNIVTVSAPVPAGVKQLFIRSSEIAYIGPEFATSPSSFLTVASDSNNEVAVVSTAFLNSSVSVCGSGVLEVYTEDIRGISTAIEAAKEGEQLCPNCGKSIPQQSYMLHSNFCARHTIRCTECNRQFFGTREIPSDHWHCTRCAASGEGNARFHELKHDLQESGGGTCACKEFTAVTDCELAFHRATSCPLRLHICQFCHLLVPQGETTPVDAAQDLTAHESQCGNRTTDCPLCNRPIRLRSLKLHLQEHEQHRRQRKPPQMCSNRNCPNIIRSSDSSPALGLCASCFGPLSVPGSNSDMSRVRARVERRYLLQMTRGCGKSWCQNHYCKTGSGISRSVSDSVNQARQLLENDLEHFFCVDETSTRKAMFVQLDDGIYDRGWRGMAISSCATETEAAQWLERNASRLNE